MAIVPTPVPTPNIPSGRNYSVNYKEPGSILGAINYSSAPSPSGPLASMMPIGPQRPVNYQPAATQRVNTTRSSNQQSGNPFDFTSNITSPDSPLGGGGSQMDVINQQFNDFNNYLGQQESMARSNFADTQNLLTEQKTNTEKAYNQERQTQTEGIKKNESLNLSKVRQLLSDLQQSNAARTAVTGGGSSTSEALAERFGRRAQEGLGNVTSQADQALQRVGQFYDTKITELNDNYNSQVLQAKQALDENLANISYQRNASATAKQQATLQSWQEYYNNVNQAKIQAANFQAQLDLWKQQQDNAWSAVNPFNQSNASTYNEGITPSLEFGNYQGAGLNGTTDITKNPYYRVSQKRKLSPEEEAAMSGNLNYTPAGL